ncbi:MAG TPA: DNA polymerase/3'-5' exonuclease PolX [Thermoanaerobaculia bacterium]|nr:DNA polymerase/3'-5' exonuclease PolX [Thermoanaerobaculia bacterium]
MANRREIARALEEIARYLEIGEANRFKARAYSNAARAVESSDVPLPQWISSGAMERTAGIGKTTGSIIRELAETGSSPYLEELRKRYPAGLFDLMRVPGLGTRKIAQLHEELGISSVAELEEACRSGALRKVRGFGPRATEKILVAIETLARVGERYLLPLGVQLGEALLPRVRKARAVRYAEITGSVRRRLETVGGVDICVASDDPDKAREELRSIAMLAEFEEPEEGVLAARGRRGMPVRFRVVPTKNFWTAVFLDTGSSHFSEAVVAQAEARGLSLGPEGLRRGRARIAIESEKDLFGELEIPFVEPELRESTLWAEKKPPRRLLRERDLRGVFHVHTTYSDGKATLYEMLDGSRERNFQYVGISDHSPAAYYARGLSLDRLDDQQAEIDRYRESMSPMAILKGTEADILADGSIDYGHAVLPRFDFVVASIHSRFGMSLDEMTERMVRALRDPFVTFLGHPTGRLLLSREGYGIDFAKIFDTAAEHGVIIEINGNPHRLDLDWRLLREAVDRGVVLSINPDAHSVEELRHTLWGSYVARKGGLEPRNVFNTRPVEEVRAFLEDRRGRWPAA